MLDLNTLPVNYRPQPRSKKPVFVIAGAVAGIALVFFSYRQATSAMGETADLQYQLDGYQNELQRRTDLSLRASDLRTEINQIETETYNVTQEHQSILAQRGDDGYYGLIEEFNSFRFRNPDGEFEFEDDSLKTLTEFDLSYFCFLKSDGSESLVINGQPATWGTFRPEVLSKLTYEGISLTNIKLKTSERLTLRGESNNYWTVLYGYVPALKGETRFYEAVLVEITQDESGVVTFTIEVTK